MINNEDKIKRDLKERESDIREEMQKVWERFHTLQRELIRTIDAIQDIDKGD